jgi:site-specific DNA-methyltransferase (adenine-specific)
MAEPNFEIRVCDNLDLLTYLPDNYIDLIYCDILYGTGNNFGDYQDLPTNRIDIENHYIPRITEMKRVLKPTGSIYLQMDTKINHWIRCILDDIFGYKNFVNEIIWTKKFGGTTKNKFNPKHDTIYLYQKTKKRKFNPIYKKNTGCWNTHEFSIEFDYWTDINQIPNKERNSTGKYATQKPIKLLERIIQASSDPGDLVADFYLGSGTTAVACKKLQRSFIGCDTNLNAVQITENRIKNL